ncbi:hypothetical protein DSECCO2_453050 [anaerobic digester metagenome]
MRKFVQILLFVISYAPLYLILFFQNLNDKFCNDQNVFVGWRAIMLENKISISFLLLIIISISLYFILYKIVLKSSAEKIKVVQIQDNHSEHLSYLATYILPFVGLRFDCWQNIVSTIALFYVLGHIYIKTNLILTNPTLTFFGFSISKINDESDSSKIVIHKTELKKGKEMDFVHLSQNIYLLK